LAPFGARTTRFGSDPGSPHVAHGDGVGDGRVTDVEVIGDGVGMDAGCAGGECEHDVSASSRTINDRRIDSDATRREMPVK